MPIYEYHCRPCDHLFETLIRGESDVARCPKCGNLDLAKQFSVPAAVHSGRSSALPVCAAPSPGYGCGLPQCGAGGCGLDS